MNWALIPLSTLKLDLFQLDLVQLDLPGPTVNDFLAFLNSFARIESVANLSILSVPDDFGPPLLFDASSRHVLREAQSYILQAVKRFSNLEHLTFVFGYRAGFLGFRTSWRGLLDERLVRHTLLCHEVQSMADKISFEQDQFVEPLASLTKLRSLQT